MPLMGWLLGRPGCNLMDAVIGGQSPRVAVNPQKLMAPGTYVGLRTGQNA